MDNKGVLAADAPVSVATVPALLEVIADDTSNSSDVAAIVGRDAGLAARVLALANSAAFGLPRNVTDIDQAVKLVGANMVQTIAIAGSCNLLGGAHGLPDVQDHAIRVGCAARILAKRSGLPSADAFTAGLLHDVGEILLWRRDPDTYANLFGSWSSHDEQLRDERGAYGIDHCMLAREQLSAWKLPGVVVDAVGDHHRPDLHFKDLSSLVIAAESLANGESWTEQLGIFEVATDDMDILRAEVADAAAELTGLFNR